MSKDVEFQDIVYTVKERSHFLKEAKSCKILQEISGLFKNGQLSAIMGPSGAGKSSLLNAISGLTTSGVSGTIKINKKASCYITQEDVHRSLLTVKELMELACSLKVKKGHGEYISNSSIIKEILSGLHLDHRQNVTADCLSGGERKRLSIALELVANPTIFFLDEPTSGLDDVTAVQCIRLLKDLAKQGRTVVCTIHQPSAAVFGLFDKIFVVAKGLCVYQGSPQALVPMLAHLNLECPKSYNPADYIIELCDMDDETAINYLSETMHNGKSVCLLHSHPETGVPTFQIKSTQTSMLLERNKPPGGTLLQKMKAFSRLMQSEYATSSFYQFFILFKTMMLMIWRHKTALYIQFFHHLLCGGAIGLIFYNTADEGEKMFEHLKYCMGVIFFVVYTQVMVPILSYPQEVKIVKKECFNRWYGLVPYYAALTLSRVPVQILLTIVFTTLVYWMSGLPAELWRFAMFSMIAILISFVSEGLGLAIGATFSITNGCAMGPMVMAPFLGLACYGFDFATQIPLMMNVLMKFSFIRGGVVSLVYIVFGFNRSRLNCTGLYCHFDDPKVLLQYLDIDKLSLWTEIGILLSIMIFFRILCYMSLRKRFHT